MSLLAKRAGYTAGDASLGGRLVTTGVGSLIDYLRQASVLTHAQSISVRNPMKLPTQAGTGELQFVAGTTAATLATGSFGQITLEPKVLTGMQQADAGLFLDGHASDRQAIDQITARDALAAAKVAIETAALQGDSSANQPVGLLNNGDVGTILAGVDGGTLSYDFATSPSEAIGRVGADPSQCTWVFHPSDLKAARQTARSVGVTSPIVGEDNRLRGSDAKSTNVLTRTLTCGSVSESCGFCGLVDSSDLLIAEFNNSVASVFIDPYVLSASGVVRCHLRLYMDLAWLHPGKHCLGLGLLTSWLFAALITARADEYAHTKQGRKVMAWKAKPVSPHYFQKEAILTSSVSRPGPSWLGRAIFQAGWMIGSGLSGRLGR